MIAPEKVVSREVQDLAAWAVTVSIADVPTEVQRRALMVLADDLAAAVASRDEPEVASARASLLAGSHSREALVWDGLGSRTDRWTAATTNAIACNWAELDEGYRLAVCHAGLYAVPAALAEAAATKRSLGELLIALVVSYEVAARFAGAWAFRAGTLHPHGVFSPLGAAVAVAKLRNLDHRGFVAAIGGSTTFSLASPFSHAIEGILVRNAWAGAGAWLGMRAVDWATAGISGSPTSPFDVYSRALCGEFRGGVLTDGLGDTWAISSGYHKVFACCQYGHSAVQASLALRARIARDELEAVENVEVQTHRLGMTIDNDSPGSTLAGKFSMQHIVATTLLNGRADHQAFSALMLDRDDVARLRRKVKLSPFLPELTPPQDRPARVTIRFQDGRSLTEECLSAPGGPDRPFGDEVLLAKISSLTADVYPRFAPMARRLLRSPGRYLSSRADRLFRSMLRRGGDASVAVPSDAPAD